MPHSSDLDLNEKDVTGLGSVDAVASFFTKLGYDTSNRAALTPEAIGLAGDSAKALKRIELLSEDSEQFLRVVFAQPKSLTAKVRNDLARVLGKSTIDHLLVLSPDFDSLEFVYLDKRRKESKGPAGIERVQVIPKFISLDRRRPSRLDLRTLRRFTWTCRDALDQFDKLRSVFEAAAYTGEYFQNRGLFSDYFLRERLRDNEAWRDNPSEVFTFVRNLMEDAGRQWNGKEEEVVRKELYEPLFERLGFKAKVNRPATSDHTQPDYLLKNSSGKNVTAAFVYPWERWLDGPDANDPHTPDENPGACVVTALDEGLADWIIVTNGRQWRIYGRKAHARSTNFYEVDLIEALTASGDTDPNEAFRYWWLFFRPEAFQSQAEEGCWLDAILQGSRDYAKRLGERLKDRVFFTIFPHLAQGFLDDRKQRLGIKKAPTREELDEIFEATLTLLYRLLFLLYAESRDLLPIREAPYQAASLKKVKEEIAEKAGVAESDVAEAVKKAYSPKETGFYDRLLNLCQVVAEGESVLNVPKYNGGLFNIDPKDMEKREERIARFLLDHKVPDRQLALAIDRLARDQDERTLALGFIDYKSLEVRHLGSIYEGLLEFKLKIADEDLTTKTGKGGEKYIPLSAVRTKSRKQPGIVVRKGDVYLSNDKAERKASGSYYTPDDIVEYIVANTIGPVLDEKLEALRPEFRKVRKTFDNELTKLKVPPVPDEVQSGKMDARAWANLKTFQAHKDLVERLFDLKVCDPAMGSGHFLVEVVDFVTDRLVKFLNQFPVNPVNIALERTRDSILESLGQQGVTVDPTSLTDINLLKRFVLKRCVYGVDLNPMAVELAKVSLWLDCFTLGAPLNFLDHHLRCGNSLIGATFQDLEAVTSDRPLLSLDYEPLLRAINHVLHVSRLADATAADVAESIKQYSTAREALTGYQVILDLLVAKYFGFPDAPGIVEQGDNIDLTNRDRFLESLHDDEERELVLQVEKVARQRDRRFFHWEIEFPEIFFGLVRGSGQNIKHKDRIQEGSAGFDCVVGNPPYDVLAEKELGINLDELQAYLKDQSLYEPACRGKQNLYKLFICRDVQVLAIGGQFGHIVPMALLGDDQAAGVRKLLLECTSFRCVEAFPQKDDARNRVFPDAKLSTCLFVTSKTNEDAPFRSRIHPGKAIEAASPSQSLRRSEVQLYDPSNMSIVACSQQDWDLAVRIMKNGRMRRLGDYCVAYQGEVNETNDTRKGNLSLDPKDGQEVVRGAMICLYSLRAASQGESLYLRTSKYLKGKKPGTKAWHHKTRRVGIQESSPQNNFRRIIASIIPAGEFCNHVINYFPEPECKLPLEVLLGLLNSKLADWYFRLGSTNAHINHYQVYNLPAPDFSDERCATFDGDQLTVALSEGNFEGANELVSPALQAAPFPADVIDCISAIVKRIMQIESQRGEISRSARSALAPEAQPYQDLIDRILYRMAGLTEDEATGLEERLGEML